MNTQMGSFAELQCRIARLETQNLRFKRFGTVGLIVVACLVVMGQAAPSKKTVEANEFILREDSGNIRARLFLTEKRTTKMSIPGIGEPVPVTYNPRPRLLYTTTRGKQQGSLTTILSPSPNPMYHSREGPCPSETKLLLQ